MTKIDYEAARSGKRKVTTRCGYPVRLVSNEGKEPYVLVGYYTWDGVEYGPQPWMLDGRKTIYDFDPDLIQETEVIEVRQWLTVYPAARTVGNMFDTADDACKALIQWEPYVSSNVVVPFTIRIVGDKVEIFGGTEERKDDAENC